MAKSKEGTRIAGRRDCPREHRELLKGLDVWDSLMVDDWVRDHNRGKSSDDRVWVDAASRRRLKEFHKELLEERLKRNSAEEDEGDWVKFEVTGGSSVADEHHESNIDTMTKSFSRKIDVIAWSDPQFAELLTEHNNKLMGGQFPVTPRTLADFEKGLDLSLSYYAFRGWMEKGGATPGA
ncbi:uncharacterized protein LOC62_07G009004 [Vanrija pseudolonga]|uniref:Uncharacterized protein n=1 Tax=Vanrija pseudolonga TaxID=143232 RepID=A0AAF0YHX5_9TREE|nr:hypothetical protein LOC62_07G009004 [Vanrija pseudolonga]